MTLVQALDREEFASQWAPAFRRVFGGGPFTAGSFWDDGSPPPHPGWRFLPMLNYLSYGPSPRSPHHDDRRENVHEEMALLETLRSLGRDFFCLEHIGDAWLLPPLMEAICEVRRDLPNLITSFLLFDRHADWGVMCNPVACSLREDLYRTFGWTAPPYPNKGELFQRRPDEAELAERWLPVFDRLLESRPERPPLPSGGRHSPCAAMWSATAVRRNSPANALTPASRSTAPFYSF